MNLRELTGDQEKILAQVESGDFSIEDVSDHLEMLGSERTQKIENYLHVINRIESQITPAQAELDRLQKIVDTKKQNLANIKQWLLISLKDGEKHEFDLFTVSRVKGRQVVNITDDDAIIEDYTSFKEVRSVDKRTILADLKAGKEVTGAELTTGKASLRIK